MARLFAVLVLLVASQGPALAYELRTHAQLTLGAANRSALLRDASVANDLGIDLPSTADIGATYFDGTATAPRVRTAFTFEATRMPESVNRRSAMGWLLRGAIREDDVALTGCLAMKYEAREGSEECNPRDDPYGDIDRPLRHFYDPIADRGLNRFPFYGDRAPDWALGRMDSIAQGGTVDSARRNHFSIVDARQAMYYALSGRVLPRQTPDLATRNAWWATTFRSLGDAMHLLQDMAQPQHTRNEPHSGSVFEAYIEARARELLGYKIDGTTVNAAALDLGSHPVPALNRYANFWSTGKGVDSLQGKGLANFSNRGFFTEERNFGSRRAGEYPRPTSLMADYQSLPSSGEAVPGTTLKYITGTVVDARIGSEDRIRMAAESTFSANFGNRVFYVLNRFVYDDQAALLIPRAVAYSAGLLDYFFRGRIDLVKDRDRPNGLLIRNLGPEPVSGVFDLYFDTKEGLRKPVKRTDGTDVAWPTSALEGSSLGSGKDFPVAADFAAPADAKNPGEYILVFRGDMGEEKSAQALGFVGAVAAKVVKAPKPSALYIAGVDSQNRVLTFKVDANGMRQLNGFDDTGRFFTTDFRTPSGPLKDIDPLFPAVRAQYFGQEGIPRIARTRQVAFSDGLVPSYETIGLAVHQSSGSFPLTYVRNASTGQLEFRFSAEAAWLAKGEDGADYEFQIIELTPAGLGKLRYVRTARGADGSPLVTAGAVPLPVLSAEAAVNYFAFRNGRLFISPDGLSVKGFLSTLTGAFSDDELRIVPGSPPSIGYVRGAPYSSNVVLANESGCPSGGSCVLHSHFKGTSRDPTRLVDYVGGVLRSWRRETDGELRQDKSREAVGTTEDTNPGACPFDLVYASRVVTTESGMQSSTERFLLEGGALAYLSRNDGGQRTLTETYLQVDHHLASGGGTRRLDCDHVVSDPPQRTSTENLVPGSSELSGSTIIRTFTGAVRDSIIADISGDANTHTTAHRFRSIALLPTGSPYVGDASPAGELFIALPDKSFIFYEPVKGNGMPETIAIPPHVTRIIAAIWL
ncbi:MAG: hypothetical protein IPH30_11115 [Betaproteobacteria bacterium]|nr:hypothetical protein [Betaproteobacteria bacterium]